MATNCENTEIRLTQLEEKVSKLESQREIDYEKIIENNTKLATIIVKLENITSNMEGLSNNLKEVAQNTTTQQKEDIKYIETVVMKLSDKVDTNTSNLEKMINERTISKDYKTYNNIKWLVGSGFISALVAYISSLILK